MKLFFRQFFFLLDHPARKQLPFLFLLFLISACFDVIGIGMVGAFMVLVVNVKVLFAHLPETWGPYLVQMGNEKLFSLVGAAIIIAFFLKTLIALYSQKKIAFFVANFATRLKSRLMTAFQYAAYSFHLQHNSGTLTGQVAQVDVFTSGLVMSSLNFVCNLLIMLGVTLTLLVLHPIITVLLGVMFGLIFFVNDFFIRKKALQMGRMSGNALGDINKSVIEGLGGIKEIRILGREAYFIEKLKKAAYRYAYAVSINASLQQTPRYMIESGASIFLVLLMLSTLWMGLSPVSIIPTLGIFAAACMRLLPTINQLIVGMNQMRNARHAQQVLYNHLHQLDKARDVSLQNKAERLPFSTFELRTISFRYPGAKKEALHAINLILKKGESIGIMGSSGAGKSTLINLILGLLDHQQGERLVNGAVLQDKRGWLNNLAYIPQSIFLLDDTLKRNIALGVEDNQIDEVALRNAIEMAQLITVVEDLPLGIDTMLGENGVRLSGGQRQRVALARAFYHGRDIIVMDEATSALDSETEKEVINAIKRLHGIKTMIVIAHRLTTLQYCDVIYKMEGGNLAPTRSSINPKV
jgi:ABC-type multidrug transport system fused ATPase/permease subunit